MTIKSIAKICKSHKEVTRHTDEGGNQWLGFNGALYLVPNLPDCDNEQLAAIFDISPEKYEKMKFNFYECQNALLFNDVYAAENLLERSKVRYIVEGIELEPLKTSVGVVFINTEYLAPFKKFKNGFELYERLTPGGGLHIAAKSGLELHGILKCYKMSKEFFDIQEDIIKHAKALPNNEEQISFAEAMGGTTNGIDNN